MRSLETQARWADLPHLQVTVCQKYEVMQKEYDAVRVDVHYIHTECWFFFFLVALIINFSQQYTPIIFCTKKKFDNNNNNQEIKYTGGSRPPSTCAYGITNTDHHTRMVRQTTRLGGETAAIVLRGCKLGQAEPNANK